MQSKLFECILEGFALGHKLRVLGTEPLKLCSLGCICLVQYIALNYAG
ncbi:hypothetical protein [Paraflavitalea sp. CAU 1676]|nr:hypothetical protein [Paraflavitalea sp. CAU 1676]MDF2187127.1 hypothetical protein [Paraflavitalea sp. CAU 1676]